MLAQLVLAIQDRVIAPRQARRRAVVAQIVEQPRGLFVLVATAVRYHLVRRFPICRQLLLEQLRILRQDAPRRLEDLPRAAAIFVEDDRHDIVIAVEALQDVRIGARPGEDRLLVVTDGKEVAVRLDQLLQQVILHRVHVLELVDQDVIPPARDTIGERLGPRDQFVEVDHVSGPKP